MEQEQAPGPTAGRQPTEVPMSQRVNTGKRPNNDVNPPEPITSTEQVAPREDRNTESTAAGVPNNQPITGGDEFMLEQQESYLRLPIPQESTTLRKCWRCGEEGHSKKGCNRQVSCTFCQVYSHVTKACKKYASFVRNSQGTSSKRTTPIQGQVGVRTQGPLIQGPRYVTNYYPRFQPPVVPSMIRPPVITQTVQAPTYPRQPQQQVSHTSPQDVRNDPNYINQGT